MEECIKCGEEVIELPFSSDPEGLRPDYYCGECNTRFGTRKSGNFIVSEPMQGSALLQENLELKTTIKTLLNIGK